MKPIFLRLLPLVAIVASRILLAGEATITVTPQSIASWTVVGDAPEGIADTLVLPAGAQLSRKFEGGKVAVELTSRIKFGRVPEETPVLEIGNVALVFAQVDGTGALMLVPDHADPIVLPTKVELDADGYGTAQAISFNRSGKLVSVVVGEAHNDYEIAAPETASWEVVVTSGDAAWKFDQLSVSIATPDEVPGSTSDDAAGSSGDEGSGASPVSTGPGAASTVVWVDAHAAAAQATKAKQSDATVEATTLEVFSPPSIRRGNADAARSAALGSTAKR